MENTPHQIAIFSLKQAGKELSNQFASRLMSLTLTENRGPEADQLDIELSDHDNTLDIPHRGIKLTLAIGWQHIGLINKGTFIVDDVEHTGTPDKLTIRARSADLRAGLTTQKERSWHNVTLGNIVNSIAAQNGLKAVIKPALASEALSHIDQTNESDANLLTRLAKMFDAVFTVKNNRLIFLKTGEGVTATGAALPSVLITRANGDNHRFNIADRDTNTGVRALYNDLSTAKKGEVIIDGGNETGEQLTENDVSTVTSTGRIYQLKNRYKNQSSATRAARNKFRELSETNKTYETVTAFYKHARTGKDIQVSVNAKNLNVDQATDAINRGEYEAPSAVTASADNIKTLRHIYANKANAIRAARAEYTRLQRGASQFSLTLALGRPDVSPEQPATVSGWKPVIDSTNWLVTKAIHSINDSSGMLSQVELELKIE